MAVKAETASPIVYSLCPLPLGKEAQLGFSVWARTAPKAYLSTYPGAAKQIQRDSLCQNIRLTALVDDVLPRSLFGRTPEEQAKITAQYLEVFPRLGFSKVEIVSTFVDEHNPRTYISLAKRVNVSEFMGLLPNSKQSSLEGPTMTEPVEFLWHLYVLQEALRKFNLKGFLGGIRSERFYLAAHKLLPTHNTYFVATN